MKKKCLVLVLFSLLNISIFSQEKDFLKDKYFSFSYVWHSKNFVTPDFIYEFNNEECTYKKIDRNKLYLNKNGYLYFDKQIILPGFFCIRFDIENGRLFNDSYAESRGSYFNDYFGASYSSSSCLTEKTKKGMITYEAENLGKFAFERTDHYESFSWNYNSIPWVEGEKDYGIGTTIKISTKEPFDTLSILNGYVDIEKLDLYKKNSRVKVFCIKDLDNNLEYRFELEDIVEFQFFYFDIETKNVELIIEDVYKGDLWKDTCIKGIVPMSTYTQVENSSYQKYSMFGEKSAVINRINEYMANYKLMSN